MFIGIDTFISIGLLIATLVTLIFIYLQSKSSAEQTRQTTISNKLTAHLEIYKYLQDKKVRDARRNVIVEIWKKRKPYSQWKNTKKLKNDAEIVCHTFDLAGIFTRNYPEIIDLDEFSNEYRDSLYKCYKATENMILDYRNNRSKDFWKNFQNLYDRALAIIQENNELEQIENSRN